MTSDREAVEAAAAARGRALAAQDWAGVERLLHPDFTYTNSRGERLHRAAYVDFLRHGPLRWTSQHLEDVTLVTVGSTAVLCGTVVDDLVVDGAPVVLRFATTQTYVLVDGVWSYLAGQTGPLPSA